MSGRTKGTWLALAGVVLLGGELLALAAVGPSVRALGRDARVGAVLHAGRVAAHGVAGMGSDALARAALDLARAPAAGGGSCGSCRMARAVRTCSLAHSMARRERSSDCAMPSCTDPACRVRVTSLPRMPLLPPYAARVGPPAPPGFESGAGS